MRLFALQPGVQTTFNPKMLKNKPHNNSRIYYTKYVTLDSIPTFFWITHDHQMADLTEKHLITCLKQRVLQVNSYYCFWKSMFFLPLFKHFLNLFFFIVTEIIIMNNFFYFFPFQSALNLMFLLMVVSPTILSQIKLIG